MKGPRGHSAVSKRRRLFDIPNGEFRDAQKADDLLDEFLEHRLYDREFCLSLLAIAKQRTKATWRLRQLAMLMLEHQMLKLEHENLREFDFLLVQLDLKEAPGVAQPVVGSVLKEGYSTTDMRGFLAEFRRKLERLNRLHNKIKGPRTGAGALRDFVEVSRRACKLSVARYLFTPEETVEQILRLVKVSEGVRDLDASQPRQGEKQMARAINNLPDYEGKILKGLCDTSNVYWVSETTSAEVNSLVEYPLTTVVLVIKPPGSDIEFEIKRAGRRGPNPLSVVYRRGGWAVPPSHRLDGGDMLWMLQFEAIAASRFAGMYRMVHGTEPAVAHYASRATISSIPARDANVQTIPFFTDPEIFGKGFQEMRVAMKQSVNAFKAEGNNVLDLPGDLGLSAQFLGHVAPAQAIMCGTTSFRLDKLALYLSSKGPETYFKDGLRVAYTKEDERRLADELLEEVLGVYHPPQGTYRNYEQYLKAALKVEENRKRADQIYLSLIQQIAKFWGTLLGVRGYSRGESFVARNVGLKSYWDGGEWKVRIIFMDHDALILPGSHIEKFYAMGSVPNMAFDDSYIWGRSSAKQFARSEVGCLQSIYGIADKSEGQALARAVLKEAYRRTQDAMLSNPRLRTAFHEGFIDRLRDWDTLVSGYFQMNGDKSAAAGWKKKMKEMLKAKGYGKGAFEAIVEAIKKNIEFLERNRDLFGPESQGAD
jgi:hypothetical protein